ATAATRSRAPRARTTCAPSRSTCATGGWPMRRRPAGGCCARTTAAAPGTRAPSRLLGVADGLDEPLGHAHGPHAGPVAAGVAGLSAGADALGVAQLVAEREGRAADADAFALDREGGVEGQRAQVGD